MTYTEAHVVLSSLQLSGYKMNLNVQETRSPAVTLIAERHDKR